MSASLDVADGIVAALNRKDFGTAFTAVRSYADFDDVLEDMDVLHVDIVPAGYRRAELYDRGTTLFVCLTTIAVRKRFDVADQIDGGKVNQAAIDALVTLCENFHLHLVAERLPTLDDATWEDTEVRLEFDRKALREERQFTGILRVGHRVPVVNI